MAANTTKRVSRFWLALEVIMLKCQTRKGRGDENIIKIWHIVQKSENYGVDHFVLLVHLAGIGNTP